MLVLLAAKRSRLLKKRALKAAFGVIVRCAGGIAAVTRAVRQRDELGDGQTQHAKMFTRQRAQVAIRDVCNDSTVFRDHGGARDLFFSHFTIALDRWSARVDGDEFAFARVAAESEISQCVSFQRVG